MKSFIQKRPPHMFTEILSQQDIQGDDNKFHEKYLGIAY